MVNRFGNAAFALLVLIEISSPLLAANAPSIDNSVTTSNSKTPTRTDVRMNSESNVQGFVLAIGYDNALAEITAIDVVGVASAPMSEIVVGRLFVDGGATLGVVFDAVIPPAGHAVAPGADQLIASFDVTPLISRGTADFDFCDEIFGSPPLSNLIFIDGLSVGVDQGLGLHNGALKVIPGPDQAVTSPPIR